MKTIILKPSVFIFLVFIFMTPQRLCAQTTDVDQSLLIVGTKESPPFSMKNESGTWTGISIELWRQIADKLDLNYQFKELSIPQILKGVTDGSLDAGVAAFTITSEREKKLDFSHSFYSTGLGIAVLGKDRNPFISMIKSVTSLPFLKVAFSLASLLFGIGFFIWFIEHKHNPVQFEDTPVKGIFSGFWWSAVTMTTVGFGDKTPRTVPGRLLGIVWMFSGIILISSFTAAITSSLTVARLESKIRTIADLPNVSVGTINNTTSELFLKDRHIFYITYPSPLEGLKAVQKGEIDAFLYDAPILRYLVLQTSADEIKVIHQQIARQDYGIALSQGSPLREPINQAMLENLQEGWWADTLTQYLGE